MRCHDVDSLLPLFFDGELDARRMRDVALHTARCADCESEIREFEAIQEHLKATVEAEITEVDFAAMWSGIERRLQPPRPTLWQRLQAHWERFESWEFPLPLPAAAAVAVAAVLSFFLFAGAKSPIVPDAALVASTDYANSVERLDTAFDSVALFSDPDTQTTVLWVGDMPLGVDP